MKNSYIYYLVLLGAFLLSVQAIAQCPDNNTPYGSINTLAPGQTSTVFCMYGGEFATVNVVANSTYVFSTCGGSWDSQLTLYSANGTYLAYNDDACGLQSEITWTATFTGQVKVALDRYFCNSLFSCMNLNVTRELSQPPSDPCTFSESLNCGNIGTFNLASGNGSWNPPGPWGTPGNEQVFEFTATSAGVHQINVSHSGNGWVDLFIKSGGCNQNGWTYVDDVLSSSTNNISLIAGVTYQFLIDDENSTASNGTIQITCPVQVDDPCNDITIMECGQDYNYNLGSGNGAWNPPGPWGTPGNEQVFQYTPSVSGDYTIDVNHSSSFYVDLFFKSGSCSENDWTYVDDILSSSSNTFSLIGGVTYYFLIDDENTSASNGSISIGCPCAGNEVDETINLNGNLSVFNNTNGACNDCDFRPSEDITFEINIPCPGTYTFETCDLASWDTYLYLSSSPCSNILALNDDNCSLRSSITYDFNAAGTYYLTIEGFSESSSGTFGINMTKECDLEVDLVTSTYECGYEISCNGSSDGSISVIGNDCGDLNYVWSNGATSSNNNNLSAGSYNVEVTDSWGCTANASATLTEPEAISLTTSNDQTVYYGYTPMSCATISGSAIGGCPEYVYNWSSNGASIGNDEIIEVCPESSTSYNFSVTDLNGCTSSNSVSICVIDVRCYAGNSNVQKVEVCHIPPGNPNNAHTICISENAVAAHLAQGSLLGDCSEQEDCPNVSAQQIQTHSQSNLSWANMIDAEPVIGIYPNPFNDIFTVQYGLEDLIPIIFEITDMTGRIIKRVEITPQSIDGQVQIDLSNANQGIYLLNTYIGSIKINNPIIKQ